MTTKAEYWALIEPLVREQGLDLYEIEPPLSAGGTLRIFIWRQAQKEERPVSEGDAEAGEIQSKDRGVTLDNCALVSKRISALLEEQGLYGEDLIIEVSSPGINRKLTRPEHFRWAVGERVKAKIGGESAIRASDGSGSHVSLLGRLSAFDGTRLQLEDEALKRRVEVDLQDVRQAKIEFKF